MQKRVYRKGLSSVVTTVLIILVSLVAVSIIGTVVLNSVQKSSERAGVLQECLGLDIKPTSCVYDSTYNYARVQVARGPSVPELTLSNAALLFEAADQQTEVKYEFDTLPQSYESLSVTSGIARAPAQVRVASYIEVDGKETACKSSVPVTCTAGTIPNVQYLSSCSQAQLLASSGTTYVLVQDVLFDSTTCPVGLPCTNCFHVSAPNIAFDGNGRTIRVAPLISSNVIRVSDNAGKSVIKNLKITDHQGIALHMAPDENLIRDVNFSNGDGTALFLSSSHANKIRDSYFVSNRQSGIVLSSSNNNIFTNVTVAANTVSQVSYLGTNTGNTGLP